LKQKLVIFAIVGATVGEVLLAWHVCWLPSGPARQMIIWVGINLGVIVVAEFVFQAAHRVVTGSFYHRVEKLKFGDLFIEPHPFLTFANKRNFRSTKPNIRVRYPLHGSANFSFPPVRTNNFGHLDGPTCDRPIIIPKPKGQIRVLCLGASTTGNYICHNGRTYSYPMELEQYLQYR
jgi:hypothetical protein